MDRPPPYNPYSSFPPRVPPKIYQSRRSERPQSGDDCQRDMKKRISMPTLPSAQSSASRTCTDEMGLPPAYEEHQHGGSFFAEKVSQGAAAISSYPPTPPSRRIPGEQLASPMKCVQRINALSLPLDDSSHLSSPTRISVTDGGKILVIDERAMIVCIFDNDGTRISTFKVVGIQGGCFWTEDKLVLATHRGLKFCRLDGGFLNEMNVGSVIHAKPYCFGFLAVQTKCISVYKGANPVVVQTISKRQKPGLLKKTKFFVEISDVAVNQQKLLFILDKGAGSVYVMTETGEYKSKLSLMPSSSSGVLKNVHSIAVTDRDLLIVSDPGCGKVLQFRADGSFAFCLLDFSKKNWLLCESVWSCNKRF